MSKERLQGELEVIQRVPVLDVLNEYAVILDCMSETENQDDTADKAAEYAQIVKRIQAIKPQLEIITKSMSQTVSSIQYSKLPDILGKLKVKKLTALAIDHEGNEVDMNISLTSNFSAQLLVPKAEKNDEAGEVTYAEAVEAGAEALRELGHPIAKVTINTQSLSAVIKRIVTDSEKDTAEYKEALGVLSTHFKWEEKPYAKV